MEGAGRIAGLRRYRVAASRRRWHDDRVATDWLDGYQPAGETEAADVVRIRALLAADPAPWSRDTPLHLTASALIVHPDSGRVLLRWPQRQGRGLPVGGHGDPGGSDPLEVALRGARQETDPPHPDA